MQYHTSMVRVFEARMVEGCAGLERLSGKLKVITKITALHYGVGRYEIMSKQNIDSKKKSASDLNHNIFKHYLKVLHIHIISDSLIEKFSHLTNQRSET